MIMRGKEKGDEGRSVRGKGREKMGKRKEWGMEGRGEETTEEAAIEQGKAPKIFDKKMRSQEELHTVCVSEDCK